MKHWNWLRVYWIRFPFAGRRDQQRGTGHTCQYETTSEIFAWGKLRPRTLHCTIKNCRSEQTITYDTASRATTKEEA